MLLSENFYLQEKICPSCGISKTLILFTYDRRICKECSSSRKKNYRNNTMRIGIKSV